MTTPSESGELQELVYEQLLDQMAELIRAGDPQTIEAFLAQHPEQRPDLERMLPTLQTMALMAKAGPDLTEALPTENESTVSEQRTLGDFRIFRELGRGGMGTVYEAEQLTMGRRVALKVLPFAALANNKALQRFHNEVRAAAALDHPHVVSVYSVGEERGIHYYAMQLVRGQSLADLIWQQRNQWRKQTASERADAPTIDSAPVGINDSTVAEQARVSTVTQSRRDTKRYGTAARLGIQAAEALQHAHDQGVLHRDIKPGNLLLDGEGELYVADFGLARIEADAGMTMTGDIVGTLRYMAPEQALAKRVVIDHRADIYSLGATLYELLTLQPAFDGADRSELLKQIAFEDPQPLRKIDRDIPAELETIVLKAMEKSPEDRYSSAQDVADDLLAFLESRPISAKPPTPLDRCVKWTRRHAGIVTASAIALAVLLVGSIVGSSMLLLEQDRARQAAAESAAVVDFLVNDLLAAPVEEKRKNRTLSVSEALGNAEVRVETAFVAQPLLEARIRQVIAQTYIALRELERAEPHARRALKLRTDLLGQAHHDTLSVVDTLVELLILRGKNEEARRLSEETLRIVSGARGPRDADTIEAMNRTVASMLAFLSEKTFERADSLNSKALEVSTKALGENHRHTLFAKIQSAQIELLRGNEAKAEQIWSDTLKICRTELGPRDRLTIELTNRIARLLEERDQRLEAMQLIEDLLRSQRGLYGEENVDTLNTIERLFLIYVNIGKFQEALELAQKGVAISEALYHIDSATVWKWKQHLVFGLRGAQRRNEALNLQVQVLDWCRGNLGTNDWRTIAAIQQLGYDYRLQGDHEKALPLLEEAISAGREYFQQPDEIVMNAMQDRAKILSKTERLGEASRQLEELIEYWKQSDKSKKRILISAYIDLGKVAADDDRIDAAAKHLKYAVEEMPPFEWFLRDVLAWYLATTNHEVLRDGPRAVRIATRACELTGYKTATCLDTLAAAQARVGDFESAVKWSEKAVTLAPDPATRGRYRLHFEKFKAGQPWDN